MPDWDQWDAEGLFLLAPRYEHDHLVAHLFQPHNEHRVVLTKLQNLAVVSAGGQWDQRVECLFNALLHGAIAVGMWSLARRSAGPRWQTPLFVIIAALFGLPLAWQNLLGGFHSQQYWLIGLSFIAIALVPFAPLWSGRWWMGMTAAIIALGSMGSGFLAAAVIGLVLLYRRIRSEITWRDALPTLVVMAAIVGVGLATRVEVSYHESLKAKTIHDFVFSLLRSMEWPVRDHDWVGLIMWAPWLFLLIRMLAKRPASEVESRTTMLVSALGLWVLVQLLATAYARGAGADYPASRYMDTLIFGTAVNALALVLLFGSRPKSMVPAAAPAEGQSADARTKPFRRWLLCTFGIAWITATVAGTVDLLDTNLRHELPDTAIYYRNAEGHVLGYLATNDESELVDPIPYPSASSLVVRLAHPSLRSLMPASVRPSLDLQPANPNESGFVSNFVSHRHLNTAPRHGLSPGTPALGSRPTWGSFNAAGPANTSEWRSQPLQAPLHGWLKFETAGDIGEPGIKLELHDAQTDAVLATVSPDRVPGAAWRSAYVRAPRQPFIVVASDRDSHRWLAFSSPAEVSALSYWGWRSLKHGLLIAEIAAGIALLIAGASALERRTLGRIKLAV